MAKIDDLSDKMSSGQIADVLNRSIDPIVKYLEKVGKGTNKIANFETQAEYDIKTRPYWKQIQKQFDEEEQELFLYHWKTIVAQFQKDILPTEEMQIVDMVKVDVLMNRALNSQRANAMRIESLEIESAAERSRPDEDRDMELVFRIETAISTLKAAHEVLSREFKDLQEKKFKMFTAMKATRESRIEKIESNKETLASIVQKILRDPGWTAEANRELEMMRLAAIKEKERLSGFHTYEDGEVDQPFMNCSTVMDKDGKKLMDGHV
jgi:hypothetical protein